MERTLRGDDVSRAEAGRTVEPASEWDLTDVTFIDEFDEQEDLFRVKYDSVRATPSETVLTVVSYLTGIDQLELDPLYVSIDGDALDALVTADSSSDLRVTFRYSGYEITVGTDGVVEVVAR